MFHVLVLFYPSGKYGIPAPWYFPFKASFWADLCCCVKQSNSNVGRGLLFTNIMQKNQPVFSDDKGKGIRKKMTLYDPAGDNNKQCCLLRCCVSKREHDVFLFMVCHFFSNPWHLTTFIFPPHSSFNSCPPLVWFTGYLCLHVSLRPEHSFLSGRWGFLRAPSGCCPSWSQQDLWRPSCYSEPQCFLLRGPCHLTAWSQWSRQDHHHVCMARFLSVFTVSACTKMHTNAFWPFIHRMRCLLNLICASL